MSVSGWIRRHPLLAYYALTFAISWGAILLCIWYAGMPATKEQFEARLPVVILATLGGPSVAGVLLTGLVDGRAGLRELLSRLLRWRVGTRWYAVALLTAPLVLMATLLALSLASPVFLPGIIAANKKVPVLLLGLVGGVMAGICEELGWTGFAVPSLRRRHSVLTTGLIVGVLWGAWHILPMDIWGGAPHSGGLSPVLYLTLSGFGHLVGQLPAFRILMGWVYGRTGSLLVAMLMHASFTASTMIFEPLAISGVPLLVHGLVSSAVMWVIVAAVAVANRGQLSRQPFPRTHSQQRLS